MKPVMSLFAKKGSVKETPELREAFDESKEAVKRKINLAAFDLTRPVFLITDTSDIAWGALVTHDRNKVPLSWLYKLSLRPSKNGQRTKGNYLP